MTLFTISAAEDIAEWIRQKSTESNRSTEQTISAVLKDGMERSASLSRREADLFKALQHYGTRAGIGIAAETLRFHWMIKCRKRRAMRLRPLSTAWSSADSLLRLEAKNLQRSI
jgi:hypothetical protein